MQGSGDLCDSLISIRVLPSYTNRAAICVPEGCIGELQFPYVCFFPPFFAQAKKGVRRGAGGANSAPLQGISYGKVPVKKKESS